MKKFSRIITAITAFLLTVCIFVSAEPCQIVCAVAGQETTLSKQYLKEVKMFYGETEGYAKEACEAEDFTFCPTDLNEGAPSNLGKTTKVYLGYKTTENPDEAITDLTLLDMKNTHFEKLDYEKYLDDHVNDFRTEAAQMMVLVGELDRQMNAGSPNAMMAYDTLNLFYVDENKSHDAQDNLLGNYLVNNANIEFFEKFIQRGNSMVLSTITDQLCFAASDYNADGTTWVDRSKTSEIAVQYADATSDVRNQYDQMCEDPAKRFIKAIQNFSTTYTEAKRRLDQYGETLGYSQLKGMTEENGAEMLTNAGSDCRFPEYSEALKTYALLDSIPYQSAGETVTSKAALLAESETKPGEESTEANDRESGNGEQAASEPDKNVTVTYTSNMTLAQYIMELAGDSTLEDHPSTVYPIVSSLTQAQKVALSLGGFGALTEGLVQAKDYASKSNQAITDASNKLKGLGYKDGRVYLWSGLDKSLYSKKVVQTDAKKEAAAAGKDLDESLSAAEAAQNSELMRALDIVETVTRIITGAVMILELIAGSTFWTLGTNCFVAAGINLAAGAIGSTVLSSVFGAVFCAIHIINMVANVVSLILLVFNILMWIGAFESPEFIDYSDMPDVVLDARQAETGTYSVRYDSVHSNAEENIQYLKEKNDGMAIVSKGLTSNCAEINAYEGVTDRWVAMYYSKAPAAGEPIEVTPGQEPFVTKGDYQPPQGYKPLTLIISTTAEDVNSVKSISGKTGTPLYVFFPGKASDRAAGGEVSDDGRYITNVRFSYSENQQDAINLLKKENYEYFDTNLTPYSGYTYLGYQLGSEKNALTDIRISNSGARSIAFGDAAYAIMGADDRHTGTTPDGFSLYETSSKAAGSPIVGLSIKTKRLEKGSGMEPVCLFSGGDAVDVGTKWGDNILNSETSSDVGYFTHGILGNSGAYSYKFSSKTYSYEFMSQDDPENGIYLYFQPKEQFKSKDADGNPAQRYIAGFSYFLAGDKDTAEGRNRFGSNYEYMQSFAKANGFELLTENGTPIRVMSDEAGEMTMGTSWREVWGYPVDTYNFDMYHSVQNNIVIAIVIANGDGGVNPEFSLSGASLYVYKWLSRHGTLIYHTAMYFGVLYTYNPYRAITGVAGLITPYTEKDDQIKYTGMKTPAGSFQACSVSIQGCPITSAGITAGYYNPMTMSFPLYTNYEANQHSDLSWTTDKDMEVLTHYLMTSGPRDGILPLKEGDIAFSTDEHPGEMEGFKPVCDLRIPGDYEHPVNFALDTTNKGSRYLYLYLKNNAGGRKGDKTFTNEYHAKKYVAAVFCGVGKTPEAAITNLYQQDANQWKTIASSHADISENPMITELDEIIPVDLSSDRPWYTLCRNNTNVRSLKNGEVVRGNEMAEFRWQGYYKEEKKTIDQYEKDWNCAYIGVVRTSKSKNAAYGMLKYYSDADTAPDTLNTGSTKCTLAGGPVKSSEGKYFLYYSTNTGAAAYQAPVTGIHISNDIFINGYNTVFTVKESDRVNNELPQYGQLRMRTDEFKYIHLGYDHSDLPYYEKLYLGVGKTKEEAFSDMVATTGAYAAVDVNLNYNSFSDTWIAIGYRRTNRKKDAIRDVFLYNGDDPPDQVLVSGGYMEGKDETGHKAYVSYASKNVAGVPYKLVKHNLKSGSEVLSLNEGNGGKGLYLYYTTTSFYADQSAESLVTPITNMCFTYGDVSPRYATTEELAAVFERSYYAKKEFNAAAYENPVWECVLGVTGSPQNWKASGEGALRFSLNEGIRPGLNGNGWNGHDSRVYMYVDRADSSLKTPYQIRKNSKLPELGYYTAESTFGYLKQVG